MITATQSPLELVCASDFAAQPVEWLWPGRFPVGKVSLLVGDPGTGKSLIALDVAARVSRGAAWPGEEGQGDMERGRQGDSASKFACCLPVSPASTLLLSAEDDVADTIRPRLDANGADADRIFFVPSVADLRDDLGQLREAVEGARDCRLVILDPINSYVGPGDNHFQTVVRRVLAPLARLATEKRIAVLAVAHLRKNEGAVIHRTAGSIGFVAAARVVWTVCRDDSQPGRHLMLPLKNNLAATACGLAFHIESHRSGAPVVWWDPTPIPIAAEEYFSNKPERPRLTPERAAAREFLQEALAGGPRPARDVIRDGEERGFLRRTLQRAFHEMKGHTVKRGMLMGWWWSLAVGPGQSANGKPPAMHDIFEGDTEGVSEDVTEGVSYEEDVANATAIFDELDRTQAAADRAIGERETTGSSLLDGFLETLCDRPLERVGKEKTKGTVQ